MPFSYSKKDLNLSQALMDEIHKKNVPQKDSEPGSFKRLGGGLAFHCTADLETRKIIETASMATLFRGYESMLPGRDLRQVGLVSSTASGICGGVHATASALCLEMALGLKPPPLGIVVRNLLLSCQYLNDNAMHLFILAGPDYSEEVIQKTNPEIWEKAVKAPTQHGKLHGYQTLAEIMCDLNKPTGKLYIQAMKMIQIARKAYAVLGGKYPHSESIVPGGVTIVPTTETLKGFLQELQPLTDFAKKSIGIWDDIFDFMLNANPLYEDVGKMAATMVDFGQWDHEDHYDASYENCDQWGEKRWSTPGAIVDGQLATTQLSALNAGLEEFADHSYYEPWSNHTVKTDPLGNPISPHHPWNKQIKLSKNLRAQSYSWGTTTTWQRHTFEVGAYVRMYLSALAQKIPPSQYLESTGHGLLLNLPADQLPELQATWEVPAVWNAFERNRARSYALGFNLMVTLENHKHALKLINGGASEVSVPMAVPEAGQHFGVGMWGAGRGFLAHWAMIQDAVIETYQISVPSRINAAPRTPWGALGACEQAVLNTPILESNFTTIKDFSGIDIQRAMQSFDPCMPCTTHMLVQGSNEVINRVVDTSYPI